MKEDFSYTEYSELFNDALELTVRELLASKEKQFYKTFLTRLKERVEGFLKKYPADPNVRYMREWEAEIAEEYRKLSETF